MTTRKAGILTRQSSSYQLLVPRTHCCKWTKPDTLQFKWTNNHGRAIPLAAKCTLLFCFSIESAQHGMFFLWIVSQTDRVFLFGSGYRCTGGDIWAE